MVRLSTKTRPGSIFVYKEGNERLVGLVVKTTGERTIWLHYQLLFENMKHLSFLNYRTRRGRLTACSHIGKHAEVIFSA